jgi:hypothetical protein
LDNGLHVRAEPGSARRRSAPNNLRIASPECTPDGVRPSVLSFHDSRDFAIKYAVDESLASLLDLAL